MHFSPLAKQRTPANIHTVTCSVLKAVWNPIIAVPQFLTSPPQMDTQTANKHLPVMW